MASNNHLTLAVAGSGKTRGIVVQCAAAPKAERILVLTYTTANQIELQSRLNAYAGDHPHIEVSGWFSFLITHFVRPYLPFVYHRKRLRGFDFKSPPQVPPVSYARVEDWRRYFNSDDAVRKVHLPQLAVRVNKAGADVCIRRLEKTYDHIFIDEVQDLCGYDLELLRLLMKSNIPLEMVGDIRQAILATNERESKNSKFKFMGILNWFRAEEAAGRLSIIQHAETWRCRPEIAAFADSLFATRWGFDATVSRNLTTTSHDGVFLVRTKDVNAYVESYNPLSLRHSVSSGKRFTHLSFTNFGEAKGLGRERVLVFPTDKIAAFIQKGTEMEESAAARFYVAVTRAEQSVAIILDDPGASDLPFWIP